MELFISPVSLSLSKKIAGRDLFADLTCFTARNPELGLAAVEKIKAEHKSDFHCSDLKFHQLDLTDKASCAAFKQYLSSTYGGLDILVNNAGIAYKQASTAPF